MEDNRNACLYQAHEDDNVATALGTLRPGAVNMTGAAHGRVLCLTEKLMAGHKAAVAVIPCHMPIVKYGAVIGRAVRDIREGEWVHLHNIESLYDPRGAKLDALTGVPTDISYE